ncbi:DUF4330 family protein [Gudongella sp. SC589]|uniref:DUF4330 family protein n=1 Tax=Gudongella sp. SC589 TaxID=3385990 RepID=UPI003904C385
MKRKWNWIDTVVVVLVIAAAVLFLNRERLTGGISAGPSNTRDIVMTVEVDELKPDMVTDLKVGDQIFSQYRIQNATIREIDTRPMEIKAVNSQGEAQVFESQDLVTLRAVIDAQVVTSGPYMDLGGQEVKVGLTFVLKTTEFEAMSDIKSIEVGQ